MIRLEETDLRVVELRTRMPFRYGIATLTAVKHVLVFARVTIDHREQWGVAADSLPPKWFTKDPASPLERDVQEMVQVIRSACAIAGGAGWADSVFQLWQEIYRQQERWGDQKTYPPLLWGFGVSLVERAIIDAFCRASGVRFADALRQNRLGIDLAAIHPELAGQDISQLLPVEPRRSLFVRHTVGLSDPITDDDVPPEERIDDGLPRSLVQIIRCYGLKYFKIKLSGKFEQDRSRLRALAAVLNAAGDYRLTLDGNENFDRLDDFRTLWDQLHRDEQLHDLLGRLIFVEQPVHRRHALSDATARQLLAWSQRPPMIIDESDDTFTSLPRALQSGYVGTSHKNCKGVFKGIANACLLVHRRKTHPGQTFLLSGEDLTNVGPVALLQDLAVLASLGVEHAERNGHHYFKGLSLFDPTLQRHVVEKHPDLYRMHEAGYATLRIERGVIALDSVVGAPFGVGIDPSPADFRPLT